MTVTGRLELAALALALTAAEGLDEATSTTLDTVTSGFLVPSNYWRATEVISAVAGRGAPAAELQEAYREYCRPGVTRHPE